jgi:sulfite exporter TauE/SafE
VGKLKKSISNMFSVRSFQSLFIIGLLNGLLPCGLVYIALAGALATGNAATGTLYMVLFGLGTIPMLLALGVAGNVVSAQARKKINRLIPVLVVIVGIFFILRGLNLNIPFLSPTREKIEKKFEKSLEEKELSSSSTYALPDYFKKYASKLI